MHKLHLAAVLGLALAASAASAQDSGTAGQSGHMAGQPARAADLSILPQGCRDAIQQAGMPAMPGMDMSSAMGGMEGMDEAQAGSMQAMMRMNEPMMATHVIKDPDLAFHCGMIAHHAGAIAMAEVELTYGDDEESKALARRIIEAQGPEIEEMTAWVERNAGRQ